jgi:microcystin-dependent protein
MEGVIGYTTLFAGNFAPKNWALCQGQVINIQSNTALFSILGTTYGGNGTTTFGLPDLRGRAVVSTGQGPGLSSYTLGQQTGAENITLNLTNLAAHVHPVSITATPGSANSSTVADPNAAVYGPESNGNQAFSSAPTVFMAPYPATLNVNPAGSGQPFSSRNPVLGLEYIICLYGVYPARN